MRTSFVRLASVLHARQGWLAGIAVLLLLAAFVQWGGVPSAAMRPYFFAGILILVAVLIGVALIGWHLLARPLPPGQKQIHRSALTWNQRQLLAALVGICGINIVMGGFWDEVWHRQYGLSFGEDLLWRPHLMLYLGFTLVALLAFAGLFLLLRRGQGTVQQRFRADPVLSLLVFVGAFLIYALPTDPLWHIIYGEDISAWSLPHMLLLASFIMIILLAVAIYLSTERTRVWTLGVRAQAADIFVIVVLAFLLLVTLQVFATEWDMGSQFVIDHRPAWLLPALLTAMAAFVGLTANHALRRVGAATAVGLLALLLRVSLIQLFGFAPLSANPWITALPLLVALDLGYAAALKQNQRLPRGIWTAILLTVVMAAAGFPLINQLFAYPRITGANLAVMLVAVLAASVGTCWLGRRVGDYLSRLSVQSNQPAPPSPYLQLIPPAALLASVAFILFFIFTATPPV